jgi:hypothetical protein
VEDAKKYMQMPESECGKLLNKVYEQNYKLDSEFKRNAEGEKIYNLAM